MDEDQLLSLRRAMYSGDPASMVTAVRDHGFVPSVQLVGDVLLQAVRADASGSRDLAGRCAAFLDARGWEGDPELADALRGTGAGKDVLLDYPAERAEWFAFSDDRRRGRARAWLADAGYRAVFRSMGFE
jgi:hypothetical protein